MTEASRKERTWEPKFLRLRRLAACFAPRPDLELDGPGVPGDRLGKA